VDWITVNSKTNMLGWAEPYTCGLRMDCAVRHCCACQVGPCQVDPSQVDPSQVGLSQVGPSQVGPWLNEITVYFHTPLYHTSGVGLPARGRGHGKCAVTRGSTVHRPLSVTQR